MMQPSLPPSPKAASSVYEAIRDGDWEGLLTLYATSAYDAVHSAEFARRGAADGGGMDACHHRQHSSPPSLMAAMTGRPRKAVFRDEKKLEGGAHHLTSSQPNFKLSPSTSFSNSSTIQELDHIVREIIGAEIFDGHHRDINNNGPTPPTRGEQQQVVENQSMKLPAHNNGSPNKKTRQHSPTRKLDHILFHHSSSSSSSPSSPASRHDKDMDWEKVMWESSVLLSNSRPSPNFVADRQDRVRRSEGNFKSEGSGLDADKEKGGDTEKSNHPIFEGNVANATPGDLVDGGTGSGTAQHLACVLDSPFALAMLIVLGVNVEARHTAFRRLAIHEAACADSPRCLSLLMEVGTRFSMELLRDRDPAPDTAGAATSSMAVAAAASAGDSLRAASAHSFASSPSFAAASATGFDSLVATSESFASELEERISSEDLGKKPMKKKFLPFGWNKGRASPLSMLKKSSSEECEKSPELTPFPVALTTLWEAIKLLRSGDMAEMDAAHYVLDRVKVSTKAMMTLALQCPHFSSDIMKQSHDKEGTSMSSVPFALFPGLSAVNQLFQPNHRDMQSAFIKRNVDGHGNTPLHWASFKNSIRAMDVLLSYNVDVNSRAQPSGWTPLHDAAYSDASDAVARLIAAGATVDARSHSGATPLCFAAQEDAPNATRMLLKAGADPSMRCLGNSPGVHVRANNADNNHFHSRFSGYTPLHYCAHYNASKAARVLLYESNRHHNFSAVDLLEIPDLNEKLPIHVAVARGSSLVLKELLHGGARVETASYHLPLSPRARSLSAESTASRDGEAAPVAIPRSNTSIATDDANNTNAHSTSPTIITPVSSPVLRAMIPSQPITSSKPWNCLSQKSIDACKHLIEEVEMNWTPERHTLFSPADRVAVVEVLRVGKRLEQVGRGIFLDLWPHVLSFCGRGWFEHLEDDEIEQIDGKVQAKGHNNTVEELSVQCSALSSGESSGDEMEESSFTQFQLEETNGMPAIL